MSNLCTKINDYPAWLKNEKAATAAMLNPGAILTHPSPAPHTLTCQPIQFYSSFIFNDTHSHSTYFLWTQGVNALPQPELTGECCLEVPCQHTTLFSAAFRTCSPPIKEDSEEDLWHPQSKYTWNKGIFTWFLKGCWDASVGWRGKWRLWTSAIFVPYYFLLH